MIKKLLVFFLIFGILFGGVFGADGDKHIKTTEHSYILIQEIRDRFFIKIFSKKEVSSGDAVRKLNSGLTTSKISLTKDEKNKFLNKLKERNKDQRTIKILIANFKTDSVFNRNSEDSFLSAYDPERKGVLDPSSHSFKELSVVAKQEMPVVAAQLTKTETIINTYTHDYKGVISEYKRTDGVDVYKNIINNYLKEIHEDDMNSNEDILNQDRKQFILDSFKLNDPKIQEYVGNNFNSVLSEEIDRIYYKFEDHELDEDGSGDVSDSYSQLSSGEIYSLLSDEDKAFLEKISKTGNLELQKKISEKFPEIINNDKFNSAYIEEDDVPDPNEVNSIRAFKEKIDELKNEYENDLKEIEDDNKYTDKEKKTIKFVKENYNENLMKLLESNNLDIPDDCTSLTSDCKDKLMENANGLQKDFINEAYRQTLVEKTLVFSFIEGLLDTNSNGYKAARLFGFEANYDNVPEFLRDSFPSQICMDKVEGYLDKEQDSNGGVSQYGSCSKQKDDPENYVDEHECIKVEGDVRAQRTQVTPDGKTAITYSAYLDVPDDETISYIIAISYVINGNVKKEAITELQNATSSVKKFETINYEINETGTLDVNSFKIGLLAVYEDGSTYLNLIAPIPVIKSGDVYFNSLSNGGNTEGNLAASETSNTQAVEESLSAENMLSMMR